MANLSRNLPYWAREKGYTAQGDLGSYGDLMLFKNGDLIKTWDHWEPQPNIFEVEEFIREYEDKGEEALSRC